MPVYEFACETHGLFKALRPMAAFREPCACPVCGGAAPRVMVTAPRLATQDRGRIKVHAANERSADSPRKLSEHGAGCPCCSGGSKKARPAMVRPDGSKSFPSARPWMISH